MWPLDMTRPGPDQPRPMPTRLGSARWLVSSVPTLTLTEMTIRCCEQSNQPTYNHLKKLSRKLIYFESFRARSVSFNVFDRFLLSGIPFNSINFL